MRNSMKITIILLSLTFKSFAFTNDEDFSQLVENDDFIKRLIECIYEKDKCNEMEFKVRNLLLPQLFNRNCENCTPKLKKDGETLLNNIKNRYENDWFVVSHLYEQEIFDVPGYYKTPLVPPL